MKHSSVMMTINKERTIYGRYGAEKSSKQPRCWSFLKISKEKAD